MTDQNPLPPIVSRYLAAADVQDADAVAACFTADGTVMDEGHTHRGRDEIVAWRTRTASQWTYTTAVTGTEVRPDGVLVFVHLVGDFPGGEADLTFRFVLVGDAIASLDIT